jgi:hypothetical protein
VVYWFGGNFMPRKPSDFLKRISDSIESLTEAYTLFAKDLDSINSKFKVKEITKKDMQHKKQSQKKQSKKKH